MLSIDPIREGARVMTICNACRYCEGFCAVFPAMERRMSFAEADMNYLANLCHNCTECIHACQYSPPHQFAVNVPMALAKIRLRSYEKYCWPRALGWAFRLHGARTVLGIAALFFAGMVAATSATVLRGFIAPEVQLSFYGVVPHGVMVGIFGAVFLSVIAAMAVSVARYVKDSGSQADTVEPLRIGQGLRDALTLKYLHGSGDDCTVRENMRAPWRRWFHHLTFYGFLLCFASTSIAAVYHFVLRWEAPYPFFSIPVVLGLLGGTGLLVGPVGLWGIRDRRNPAAIDPAQKGLDRGFILLLILTSATGLALLAWRDHAAMGLLLLAHLALVLTLFVSLPYGKFMHGLYRTAALIRYARESRYD